MDPPKHALIDTNILLLLLVGLCDKTLLGRAKRVQQFGPEDFSILEQFLARFDRLVLSPNILTETDNLARQLPESYHADLALILRQLSTAIIDERHVSLEVIAGIPEFEQVGLTDGSIFLMQEVVVLSDDFRLVGLLRNRGVEAMNFNHLRGWLSE